MKPYGMHKTGHTVHGHDGCGVCSGDPPATSGAGRAYLKNETLQEIDNEIDRGDEEDSDVEVPEGDE